MIDQDLQESTMAEHRPSLKRLDRDLQKATDTLSAGEARFLVDYYYLTQEDRIRASNQKRALEESEEPHDALLWLADQSAVLEKSIALMLDYYSAEHPIGEWMREQHGVGPIIAAGLLAHIDIKKAPTMGHIWRFAGLDSTDKWIGAVGARKLVSEVIPKGRIKESDIPTICAATRFVENHHPVFSPDRLMRFLGDKPVNRENVISALSRRPWNARLKVLCWKLGESFVKVSGNEKALYARAYVDRKAQEIAKNDAREFADQAAYSLETKSYGKTTEAYKHYIDGKLPPARIHLRAKRWAVKLFLAHLHEVWFRVEFGTAPPAPYPIAILKHAHLIKPPPPIIWNE